MSSARAWQLRVRDASTLDAPDGTIDAFTFTSVAGSGYPYIAQEPDADGAEIDPLNGTPTCAVYRVRVIDAPATLGAGGIIPGAGTPGGVITAALGDAQGRNVFLSRRAYLSISSDGGVTWPEVVCAGYINRLQLVTADVYEWTVGETRRLETSMTVFQTISPSLEMGTCVLGGPIGGHQPVATVGGSGSILPAPAWQGSGHAYTPGICVTNPLDGLQYICTANNSNTQPPNATYWAVLPPGLVPAGIYVSAGTYPVGYVVVGGDGMAYVSILAVPASTPPPNTTYWLPLWATLLPGWGMVQDYGGMSCTVLTLGTSTQSMKIRVDSGWWKQPVKNPGEPPWRFASGGNIPWDFSSANALIPSLCSQFGPSPTGYGGTFLSPNGAGVPKGVSTTAAGGVVDATLGGLGWIIGGICLQIEIPSTGQRVSVNAYPQFYNNAVEQGSRYTKTPVLIYGSAIQTGSPGARSILVDWHDFYRIDPVTLQPIAPVDQFGNSVPMPAAGANLMLKAVVLGISQDTPLHISMHPVDLLCTLWVNAHIQWDDTTVGVVSPQPGDASWTPVATGGGVRAQLGPDLLLVARVTQPMLLSKMFEQWIGGPLGVALRIGPDGKYQLVMVRNVPTDLPTVTWTDADRFGKPGSEPVIFDLDEQSIVQKVTFAYTSFLAWDSTLNAARSTDDVVEVPSTAPFIDEDFATYGTQEQDYTIPGGYGSATMQSVQTMYQLGSALANRIFERYGRGATIGTIDILASSPQVNVGDLVIWQSNQMPNPALNQRGGPRLVMVKKKTPHPEGYEYVVEDLGPAEQPASLAPTFTLAQDAYDPMHVVDVTITNLAAMQAAYPNGILSVEYSVPNANNTLIVGAPAAGVSGILALDAELTDLGAGVFTLPPVSMGSTVYVRAHVRPGGGMLPSLWVGWTALTLASPDSITGLTATDIGNGVVDVAWVTPDATTPIQVWLSGGQLQGVTPTVETVFISLSAFSVVAGAIATVTAASYDTLGNLMTGRTITWDTSNHGIATVSGGAVTGVAPGTCVLTATDTGVVGMATVTVTPGAGVTIRNLVINGATLGVPASSAPYGAQIWAGDHLAASIAAAKAGTAPQAAALTLLRTDAAAVASRRNSLATLAALYPTGTITGGAMPGSLHAFACPGEYYYESPNPGAGHTNQALVIQGIVGNDATGALLTALRGYIDNVSAPAACDIVRNWATINTSVTLGANPVGFAGNDGPLVFGTLINGILQAACLLDEALHGNWSAGVYSVTTNPTGWQWSDRALVEAWIYASIYPTMLSIIGPFVSGEPGTGFTNNWRSWALYVMALCAFYLQGSQTPATAADGTTKLADVAAKVDAAIVFDINATGSQAGGLHEELLRTGRTTHYDYYSFLPLVSACQVVFAGGGPNEFTKQKTLLQLAGSFELNRIQNIGSLSPSESSDYPPYFPELFEGLGGVYGTQAYLTYAAKSRPNMPGGTQMQHMSLYSVATLTSLINAQLGSGSGTGGLGGGGVGPITSIALAMGTPATIVALPYDTTGTLMTGRTIHYTSSDVTKMTIGLTTGVITPVAPGPSTLTATDTVSGVLATLPAVVSSTSYTTLAAAANASSKKFLLSVNINYGGEAPYQANYGNNWTEIAGAGGLMTEEVAFNERYMMSGASSPTAISFTLTSAKAQITKAVAQGTKVRMALFSAVPSAAAWYATYIKDETSATQAMQAIIAGAYGALVTQYGTVGSGGPITELVIAISPYTTAGTTGYAACPWFNYIGVNWIAEAAALALAIDPGVKIIVTQDSLEYQTQSLMKSIVVDGMNTILGEGISASSLVVGLKHQLDAALGFSANDQAALDTFFTELEGLGLKWAATEMDMKDDTQLGVAAGTGVPLRDRTYVNTLVTGIFPVWAAHWSSCVGVGCSQFSDQTSRYNNPPNPGTPYARPDGLAQRPCLLDASYARKGGAGSTQDVYGALMTFLATQAA